MPTLVLALAAGMAFGDGPEAVSEEMEQRLDLSGEWEGSWMAFNGRLFEAKVGDGLVESNAEPDLLSFRVADVTDEGGGRLRIARANGLDDLGVYRNDGNRLIICYGWAKKGYPTSFRAGGSQSLLVLRRVKPGP
jgi:hypothetical protein